MRIVGGELRSRRLLGAPEGVRPTSDRVRESVFGVLGDVQGCRVLDLFAGTGALAIEALSRGAESAVLVDCASASLNVIRRNLDQLGIARRARVLGGDALRVLPRLAGEAPFDLVFLDPPYASDAASRALAALVAHSVLAPRATVVVEGSKRHPVALPSGLVVSAERDYGDTRVTWLSPAPPTARPTGDSRERRA